jgi:hypothetical protein
MVKKLTPADLAKSGTEHGEQAALFFWSVLEREQFPTLKWMYAIPNGGGRTAAQGSLLKAEGVKSGVADVCLPVAVDRYGIRFHGLYIEMKKRNGIPSDVSADQLQFGAAVSDQGYLWRVAYGWEQATAILQGYLAGTPYTLDKRQQAVHDKMMEILNGA